MTLPWSAPSTWSAAAVPPTTQEADVGHPHPAEVPDRLWRDRGRRARRRRRHGRLAGDRRPGRGRPAAGRRDVLVLVTLYGGNDGLGTVVPYADRAYHDARPDLAYGADEVLTLDAQLGLNPSMKGFKALWDAKRLAVVRGVGYPKPDHSHFRSMDIWQSGSPDHPASTGWIGRWLDATRPDPLRVVSVGATLPPLAVGAKTAGVALPLADFATPTGPIGAGVAALARVDPADPPTQAMAARATATCCRRRSRSDPRGRGDRRRRGRRGRDQDRAPRPAAGRAGQELGSCPAVSRPASPPRCTRCSLGGFDTHADEKGTQSRLLGELDSAVSGFLARMDRTRAGRRSWSRSTRSSAGGSAQRQPGHRPRHRRPGPHRRPPVRGGFYGDQPSLTSLDAGDLKVTTDFRSVYGTLLERVLDTEADRVLDGTRPTLDFV